MVSRRRSTQKGGHRGEGFGIVYLEAGACGKPVVAGDDGGVAEAVEDGKTGLLVEETPEAFADVLLDLATNPEKAHELGCNALRHYVGCRTIDHMVAAFRCAIELVSRDRAA